MKDIHVHRENLEKHGIHPQEVSECLRAGRRRYLRKARRGIYQLIAQTMAGRYLEILYREFPNHIYVFHAMDARPSEVKLLKRRGKRR